MSNTQTVSINEVEITGRIVGKREKGKDTVSITLISYNGRDTYPKFLCRKELLPEIAEQPHIKLHIKGHLESYNKKTPKGWIRQQRIVADEVNREETLTEKKFGAKGRFYKRAECFVNIKGKIRSVIDDGDWYRYLIEVDNDHISRHPSVLKVSMKKIDRQPLVINGDTVCCVCTVATNKKGEKGHERFYEDIIVLDITVL